MPTNVVAIVVVEAVVVAEVVVVVAVEVVCVVADVETTLIFIATSPDDQCVWEEEMVV